MSCFAVPKKFLGTPNLDFNFTCVHKDLRHKFRLSASKKKYPFSGATEGLCATGKREKNRDVSGAVKVLFYFLFLFAINAITLKVSWEFTGYKSYFLQTACF